MTDRVGRWATEQIGRWGRTVQEELAAWELLGLLRQGKRRAEPVHAQHADGTTGDVERWRSLPLGNAPAGALAGAMHRKPRAKAQEWCSRRARPIPAGPLPIHRPGRRLPAAAADERHRARNEARRRSCAAQTAHGAPRRSRPSRHRPLAVIPASAPQAPPSPPLRT